MSAEEAQMVKALKDIAYHQKTLVAIFTTLNSNLVGLAKIVERVLPADPNTDKPVNPDEDVECNVCGLHHRASEARDDV